MNLLSTLRDPQQRALLALRAKRFPRSLRRHLRYLAAPALAAIIVVLLFAGYSLGHYWIQQATALSPKDQISFQNEALRTVAQIFGGILLLAGLFYTSRTTRIAERGEITDRFNKAIANLSDETSLTKRLGGIYALERIARDSGADCAQVTEVLCAFLRESAPWTGSDDAVLYPHAQEYAALRTDLQAAVSVLARRSRVPPRDEVYVDLSSTDLRRLNITDGDLSHCVFIGAHLEQAFLTRVRLKGSQFWRAHLEGVDFTGSDAREASFEDACMVGASFYSCNLARANFDGADLRWADLRFSRGLSADQLAGAIRNERTKLPDYLKT